MASRAIQVKNRAPAPIQITAEQILREARERQGTAGGAKAPAQNITDPEELRELRMQKRKEFEDSIRRQRQHLGTWMKYAAWEESQSEFERARSIYERALDVDYQSVSLWLKYAEFEMRNKFVNHARNVWDRAVALLPRIDQFWYKFSYMEEMLGNIKQARSIFERWMEWEPDDNGWSAYVKFEMRQEEHDNCRNVFERYIRCHPTSRAYIKYARWEEKTTGQKHLARKVFERGLQELHHESITEKFYLNFARFEEKCKEIERARIIYKHGLSQIPKERAPDLYREYISFEKKNGNREVVEEVIIDRRREQYEEKLKENPMDYDTWFDYIRLEEEQGRLDATREVYERAIGQVPPREEKRFWRRYIYFWINYALFEELQAKDMERTREVYNACLDLIPHKKFSFSKIWIMSAEFEVRQKDITAARKIYGRAIAMCGKEKIFKSYIDLELQLGEVERCRKIYSKYLETMPYNCTAWCKFAELETLVGEAERARAIYEIAINQPSLDMPEVLWRSFIDFEIEEGDAKSVRALYERLLERTSHVKVWISYGQFEGSKNGGGVEIARMVFQRAYDRLKEDGLKDERVMVLEAWRAIEKSADPSSKELKDVEARMPKRIKKRRMAIGEDGQELGWEEYYDYVFPDDKAASGNLKILEMAQKWKEEMEKKARRSL